MRQNNRRSLFVEPLEDRWVPATVRLTSAGLLVSNPFITNGTSSLTLTLTANNTFQVVDGSSTLGTYSVAGNLYLFGGNASDSITVNLNGFNYTGNVFASSGNGNDTVAVGDFSTGTASTLGGNVTILQGVGPLSMATVDTVDTSTTMTVGGSVLALSQQTQGTAVFNLGVNGIVTVGGDVTATNYETALYSGGFGGLGSATIGGSFTVNDQLDTATPLLGTVNPASVVGNNVTILAGTGLLSGPAVAGTVGGNVLVTVPGGAAEGAFLGNATVGGNFTLLGGLGAGDLLAIANSTIEGNALVNLGDGNGDSVQDAGGNVFQGNLTIQMGNGNGDSVTNGASGPFAAPVNGNLSIGLGNGNDSVMVSSVLGGQLLWHSGNGNDSLTLGDGVTPNNYNVNVVFGNGDDSFTLDTGAAGLLSGSVNGGGRVTGNTFNQQSGALSPNFTLSNFP